MSTFGLESLYPVQVDTGMIFSGKPSGKPVMAFSSPSVFTPKDDPDYIFSDQSRDLVVWFMEKSDPLYVFGPCGSGKTSLIKQLASKLNYPVFEVTGHNRLEFPDLVGHLTVK
ncbi:MAG: ATP-binding protein [Deltaproteobacteria bacterium]|nr:ATP-binding protein [Deltaproteobacteria bacterium]